MIILIPIFLLILGFVLLVKSAELFVDGASSLAYRLNVTPLVIGLTVVSFGTSAPELVVNIIAAIEGHVDMSFGNVIGSNIINILLILGISALIHPLTIQRNTVWREIPFSLLAVVALFFMCNDAIFHAGTNVLSRNDGFVLLLFFVIFITYTFAMAKVSGRDSPIVHTFSPLKIVILLSLGILGLGLASLLVVDNAEKIAHYFHVSDKVIGLTVVALGTSLPELVTSAVAAYKKNMEIAVGNIIGSNIFNIVIILGITSIIRPMPFKTSTNGDILVLTLATLLLFFTMFTGKRHRIDRWEATLFLVIYCAYVSLLYISQ